MKNYKTTLILFIIAVLLILCNYIIIINFNYKFINNDIIKIMKLWIMLKS